MAKSGKTTRQVKHDGFTYQTTAPDRNVTALVAHYQALKNEAERECGDHVS